MTGKHISHEELFRFSNGHFLVDERRQFAQRYVKFDVDKLCELVTSITRQASPVCKIEKREGGFSKALMMTMENGAEVVAKIPCRNAGQAKYLTASEVAVLEYGTWSISASHALKKHSYLLLTKGYMVQ